MKNRILLLLLALALLLTACGPGPGPESGATGAAPTAEPTKTEAHATEAPKTEPPATEPAPTEPPATEPAPAYPPEGSRTAGGVLVHVDPSAYRPHQAPAAKYSRLREGPLERFEPSDDYGAVYPYQAARLFYGTEEGETWEIGGLYGFMDRTGRILTDGLYNSVAPMRVYADGTEDPLYLPYWVTSRLAADPKKTGAGDSPSFSADDTRYGVVSMDGSFALDCDYLSVQALENGFVCVESWSPCSFTVCDLAGRPVLTEAELFGDEKPVSWRVDYGEGLYLLMCCDANYRYEYWFLEPDGARRLGPYASAKPFREGLANVSPDGKGNGFIDKNGDWIIQPNYSRYTSFQGGAVLLGDPKGGEVVLDRSGRELLHSNSGEYLYDVTFAFECVGQDGQGQSFTRVYDRQGRLLCSCPGIPTFPDDRICWYLYGEDSARVCSLKGDRKELELDQVLRITRGVTLRNGELCAGYIGTNFRKGEQCFILEDLSGWESQTGLPTPASASANFTDVVDECSGERWYFCWSGTAWEGVNEAAWLQLCGREAEAAGTPARMTVPLRTPNLVLRGELVCGVAEDAFCCLDRDGQLVFRWPLDAGD